MFFFLMGICPVLVWHRHGKCPSVILGKSSTYRSFFYSIFSFPEGKRHQPSSTIRLKASVCLGKNTYFGSDSMGFCESKLVLDKAHSSWWLLKSTAVFVQFGMLKHVLTNRMWGCSHEIQVIKSMGIYWPKNGIYRSLTNIDLENLKHHYI